MGFRTASALLVVWMLLSTGCTGRQGGGMGSIDLTHDETLQWIADNHAWRRAKKTKPIWARLVTPAEVGKEFQTADHAVERAQAGYWLCVGVAGEPWFQKPDKVLAKYDANGDEVKQFAFDAEAQTYQVYKPKDNVYNWVAQVQGVWKGSKIERFEIKPNYDMDHPLAAPAGGYVVKNDVPDPYKDGADDVWLVQEALFTSTYELAP